MKEYIIQQCKKIIYKKFYIEIEINIDEYDNFLSEKRKKEIQKYKEYNLVSPQIYNICYFILTKQENINKDEVKDKLKGEVDNLKKEMRTIQILRYSPNEYKLIKEKEIEREKEIEKVLIKNLKPKILGIDWNDIPEYEIIRGDWNSDRI